MTRKRLWIALFVLGLLLCSPLLARAQVDPNAADPSQVYNQSNVDPSQVYTQNAAPSTYGTDVSPDAAPSAAPTGVPCTGVGPGGMLIPVGCDPAAKPPPEQGVIDKGVTALKHDIETPCTITHPSLVADALGGLADSVDTLLSFNGFALTIGAYEVNVAQMLFFVLFTIGMIRFYQEVQRMNTIMEMLTSTTLKIMGIAAIMCFITLAGGTNAHSFVGQDATDAGQTVPMSTAVNEAGHRFFERTIFPGYKHVLTTEMRMMGRNLPVGVSMPDISDADNTPPTNNSQMIHFTMCETIKPLEMATIIGFLVHQEGGNWVTNNVLTNAVYKVAWEVLYVILMLPASAAMLISGFVWMVHNDMLAISANLVAVLGIFTLGFLGLEQTRQWGMPYLTLLYNIFVTAFVLGAIGGLVMVFGRSTEIMLMRVALDNSANQQSAYQIAMGCLIFYGLAALVAMFANHIVKSIVQGTLAFTGAEAMGVAAAATGLGLGTMAAALGMLSKAINAFANRKKAKNSVGGEDKNGSKDATSDQSREAEAPHNQPKLPQTGKQPTPNGVSGEQIKEPRERAQQHDANEKQPDAIAQVPNAVGAGESPAESAQPSSETPEHAAAMLADVGESANLLAAAANREHAAAAGGKNTTTAGVTRGGLNQMRQKISAARQKATAAGDTALASRMAIAETLTKKAESGINGLSAAQRGQIGNAVANLARNIGNAAAFGESLDALQNTVAAVQSSGANGAGIQGLASATRAASALNNPVADVQSTPLADAQAGAEELAGSMDTVAASMQGAGPAPQAVGLAARVLSAGARAGRRGGYAALNAARAVAKAGGAVLTNDKAMMAIASAGAGASLRALGGALGPATDVGAMHIDAAEQLDSAATSSLAQAPRVAPAASTIQPGSIATTAGSAAAWGQPGAAQMATQAAQAWVGEAAHARIEQPGVYPPGYGHLADQFAAVYQSVANLGSVHHPAAARGLAMLDATSAAVASGRLTTQQAYAALTDVRSSFIEASSQLQSGGAGAAATACMTVADMIHTAPPAPKIDVSQLSREDLARYAQGEPSPTITMTPDSGRVAAFNRALAQHAPGLAKTTGKIIGSGFRIAGRAAMGFMEHSGGIAGDLLKHSGRHAANAASTQHTSANHLNW